ncbi:MAG: hypothetical protein M3Z04_00495 [Chloroflexota bacterium]|nr:hypothetical protein [Chloroflexota bacterium]
MKSIKWTFLCASILAFIGFLFTAQASYADGCLGCKGTLQWTGGTTGASTTIPVPNWNCQTQCLKTVIGEWAKPNGSSSYVNAGFMNTYNGAVYFYAYYTSGLGYQENVLLPVTYGGDLAVSLVELGLAKDSASLCNRDLCNTYATPVPASLFGVVQIGTRVWDYIYNTDTVISPNLMKQNTWLDNQGNQYFQFVDGTNVWTYNPPYIQDQEWRTPPSSPGSYGGTLVVSCNGRGYICAPVGYP